MKAASLFLSIVLISSLSVAEIEITNEPLKPYTPPSNDLERLTDLKEFFADKPRPELPLEDLSDFEQPNATDIFMKGFARAMIYARGIDCHLKFEGTGALARSIKRVVNPIELQKVSMRCGYDKNWTEIGTILPEKEHLTKLKSSSEVYSEIRKMLVNALSKPVDGKPAKRFDTPRAKPFEEPESRIKSEDEQTVAPRAPSP